MLKRPFLVFLAKMVLLDPFWVQKRVQNCKVLSKTPIQSGLEIQNVLFGPAIWPGMGFSRGPVRCQKRHFEVKNDPFLDHFLTMLRGKVREVPKSDVLRRENVSKMTIFVIFDEKIVKNRDFSRFLTVSTTSWLFPGP